MSMQISTEWFNPLAEFFEEETPFELELSDILITPPSRPGS